MKFTWDYKDLVSVFMHFATFKTFPIALTCDGET